MMRGGHSASSHCVPTLQAKDAAPVAMSWPVGCELMPPSEQKERKPQGFDLSHALSGGMGGGGGAGSGGGGRGRGACGALLKESAVTEETVPGPQSAASVRKPQTCVIESTASVMKTDGTAVVEGRPSWQKLSFANWQESSPSNWLMTLLTRWRGPHCVHCVP